MTRAQGKIILLGASSLVGAQLCLQLALAGYHVIGVGSSPGKLRKLAREMADARAHFEYVVSGFQGDLEVEMLMEAGDVRGLAHLLGQYPLAAGYKSLLAAQAASLKRVVEVVGFQGGAIEERLRASEAPPASVSRIWVEHGGEGPALVPCGLAQVAPGFIRTGILSLLDAETPVRDLVMAVAAQEVVLWSYARAGATLERVKEARLGRALAVSIEENDRGHGVFAGKAFKQGELLFGSTGKVLGHQTEHSLQIDWGRHLEPDAPVRFINHSCEPNAGVKTNARGFPDFYALRDLKRGEEITFDYAMTEFSHQAREDPALEFDLRCRCGSASCRGKLGYFSELPQEVKEKYRGFISDYLLRPRRPREGGAANARS